MPWENNPMFCILKDALDTDKLVEIVEAARIANMDFQCVVCGEKDTPAKGHWQENHTADCLVGVMEEYLMKNGFWVQSSLSFCLFTL